MPRGDRRGPEGLGPMTGRGAGFCEGAAAPGFMNYGTAGGFGAGRNYGGRFAGAGFGRGIGRGPGRGNGRGFMPYYGAATQDVSPESEKGFIENEVTYLKNQLKSLEGRLSDMKDDK